VTGDLERRHLEHLLFLHAHPPLGQLQYLGLPHVDLQAVAQQFAFDTLFVLAALRQMVGAASEK